MDESSRSVDFHHNSLLSAFILTETLSTQVEYANKAVENSGTVIGLRCKDGVVLAVEKLVQSKLLVPGANRRIATIDLHAGVVSSTALHLSLIIKSRTCRGELTQSRFTNSLSLPHSLSRPLIASIAYNHNSSVPIRQLLDSLQTVVTWLDERETNVKTTDNNTILEFP